jgi:hypothetical protein
LNHEFHAIFEMLYATAIAGTPASSPFNLPMPDFRTRHAAQQVMREALEELDSASSPRLRSDARFFLAMNFADMVVLPLLLRRRLTRASVDETSLSELVRNDISKIVRDAARAEGVVNPEGLSARAILEASARMWSTLAAGAHQIWGGDDE